MRIRTRLTSVHTTFAFFAEVIDSTKRLYSSEALLVGIPLAPSGVVIEICGRTIRLQALNGQSMKVLFLLLFPPPYFLSRVA